MRGRRYCAVHPDSLGVNDTDSDRQCKQDAIASRDEQPDVLALGDSDSE